MNVNQIFGLFASCFLAGFFPSTASHTHNFPALKGLLNYMNDVTREVNTMLEVSHHRSPGPCDCYQILNEGHTKSGIYRIWPQNWQFIGSFQVYCDMETDGGGWTVIQRRGEYNQPKDFFYKTWVEYQRGFGKLNEDFWLGNDRIFAITDQGNYSLRIDMADLEGEKRFAVYGEFWIENEKQLYKLHISQFSGDAGDSFTNINGMRFTTKDMDNDVWEKNCAEAYKGGWWYSNCHLSNLNGLYHKGYHQSFADGVNWKTWRGYNYSLPIADMKIRPF